MKSTQIPETCVEHILTYLTNQQLKNINKKYREITYDRSARQIQDTLSRWTQTRQYCDIKTLAKIGLSPRYREYVKSLLTKVVINTKCAVVEMSLMSLNYMYTTDEEYDLAAMAVMKSERIIKRHAYSLIYSHDNILSNDLQYEVYRQLEELGKANNNALAISISIMLTNMITFIIKEKVWKMSLPILIDMVPDSYIRNIYDMLMKE